MKNKWQAIIVAQSPTPLPTTQSNFNLSPLEAGLLTVIISGLTALGVPKLLELWGKTKVEGVQSDRRREDSVYKTLLDNSQKAQDNLTETVRTLMANQTSQTSELFQLANMMVVEVKELREVVASMVLQDHKKTEAMERLNYEIQDLKNIIEQKTDITRT
ncbi:hypothetical protein TUMEXPCC7403_16965 [Tumidithrix helvetica PCC 7403]|uniref:hypothetical protein n=1 Tax=Tumidithrix helvetica TaxID=3457545 RepID=UPI003C87D4FD